MSSIKDQVLAQQHQQGQYSEADDKYLSVLKQYNTDLKDEEVAAEVKKILDEKVADNETLEVKKFLLGSVELTSLHTEDTEESILRMIEKVNSLTRITLISLTLPPSAPTLTSPSSSAKAWR